MKRMRFFLLSILLALTAQVRADIVVDGSGQRADALHYYLFAYFEGTGTASEQEHLRFAISENGTDWLALNNNRPIILSDTICKTHGIRDPHILRAEDGKAFLMVATDMKAMTQGWDSNPGIVLMRSTDLVHWTHSYIDFPAIYPKHFGNAKFVWAPQTIYDPEAGKYMIYFSYSSYDNESLYTYYAYANADFTALESEPQVLFMAANTCLDNDIILKDGTYHMFYKGNDGNGKDGIMQATATSLKGPWTEMNQFIDVYANTSTDVEGSGVFKFIDRDEYVLMYDLFKSKRYEYQTSTDLYTFSSTSRSFTKDFQPRHGTVIAITGAEAEAVVRAFPSTAVSVKGEEQEIEHPTFQPVGRGDYYLYNVDKGKYATMANKQVVGMGDREQAALFTLQKNDGAYSIKTPNNTWLKMGYYDGLYLWADDGAANFFYTFEETDQPHVYTITCKNVKVNENGVNETGDWRLFYDTGSHFGVTNMVNATTAATVNNDHWALVAPAADGIDFEAWRKATEQNPYDITRVVQNPTGTDNYGWQRNSNDAASGYNKQNSEFASTVYSGVGIESWYWAPVKSADLIWQDVEGVLPGTYRVTAYVVGQIYNDNTKKGQCGTGSYLFAGSEKVAITSNKWQQLSVTCTVGDNPTLRIGICGDETNENDWVSIADVKVECLAYGGYSNLRTLVLDERYDVSAAREQSLSRVAFYRTLSTTAYTPICLPFDMTATQAEEAFAEVLEVTGITIDGDVMTVTTEEATAISAATPYLVKGKKDGRQRVEVGEAIVSKPLNEAQPVLMTSGGVSIIGTYRAQEAMQDAWLPIGDGRQFKKAEGLAKVKGYSFWMKTK